MTIQEAKLTPEHKNVFCAIAAAQLEFGTVSKGSTNPAFKSKYADLADVASVVIPVLARHGVCVIQYLVGDNLGAMRTEFVHGNSETRISCDVPLIVDRQNMQGMKSATTYAKRIGLESLSGVAPEDDDGNAASKAPPKERAAEPIADQMRHEQTVSDARAMIASAENLQDLRSVFEGIAPAVRNDPRVIADKDARKAAMSEPVLADEIPY